MTPPSRRPKPNAPKRQPANSKSEAKRSGEAAAEAEGELSAWGKLSRGTKTLVALAATTAVVTVVPGVVPWVSDRVLDLTGQPLVDVDSRFGESDKGIYVAAAQAVAGEVPAPTTDPRFVPAGQSQTRLTVEGRRAAKIAVVDLAVRIVERGAPRTGTLFAAPPQGEEGNTLLRVDLDSPTPAVRDATGGGPYFDAKHRELGRGEIWVSTLVSSALRGEYAWRLHMTLRYRGKQSQVVVPPEDEPPFRMTAFAAPGDYQVQYTWVPGKPVARTECAADRAACAATRLPVPKRG